MGFLGPTGWPLDSRRYGRNSWVPQIKDGDDFYGKNVILASRVAGKAVGGEILVSSLLRQLVESSVSAAMFGEPRDVELKCSHLPLPLVSVHDFQYCLLSEQLDPCRC